MNTHTDREAEWVKHACQSNERALTSKDADITAVARITINTSAPALPHNQHLPLPRSSITLPPPPPSVSDTSNCHRPVATDCIITLLYAVKYTPGRISHCGAARYYGGGGGGDTCVSDLLQVRKLGRSRHVNARLTLSSLIHLPPPPSPGVKVGRNAPERSSGALLRYSSVVVNRQAIVGG